MLDSLDRQLVVATQAGLPLVSEPYRELAETLGVGETEVMARLRHLLAAGAIRRIGVIPNHYALGIVANGMSVWDVPDDRIASIGARIGRLDFVSHCYARPRHLPRWPYNLFAMVHGRSRAEVKEKVAVIADLIGPVVGAHDVLFSKRVLKKAGLRIVS